jgi:FkbM family methyltransferase
MIPDLIVRLLGRNLAWRLGRKVYMIARGDMDNDMSTNGEWALIDRVLAHHARQGVPASGLKFWDVGANLGNWTNHAVEGAARLGVALTVDAFEPAPQTFQEVSSRFASVPAVKVHQQALSDFCGTAQMDIVGATAGTNALATDGAARGDLIDVTISTGDAFAGDHGIAAVHLVKIDAEGHDLAVIRGMGDLLATGAVGVVQFEYNHRWLATGSSLYRLFNLVDGWPYAVARVTSRGLEVFSGWNQDIDRFFECNYALVHRSLLPALATATGRWDSSNVLVVAR